MNVRLSHINPGCFNCINKEDVITAKVSDHHPVIHDGVLFWNIMMQGKLRNVSSGASYNNGLGIVETEQQYINRLMKVADIIAEIMHFNPSIDVINICEGPIQSLHINTLLHSLKKYNSMDRFFIKDVVHQANIKEYPNWGLLMLADNKYKVDKISCDFLHHSGIFNKLANRFQIWELTNDIGKNKYVGLGHFPFGGDERITEKNNLSIYGQIYCNLVRDVIDYYSDEEFILCADFNLNPYLISEWQDRSMDLIVNNNSILFTKEEKLDQIKIDAVTVDGILLSKFEKQKYYSSRFNFGLFAKLVNEDTLVQSSINEHLIQDRHKNSSLQRKYDEHFGLALR